MRLERASFVGVERAYREALTSDAVESLAEDEMLGEPVACDEERLFDLHRGQPELGGRLGDP